MPSPLPTAPISLYRDNAVFERERTAIFSRTWQLLGLESDMRQPGDYHADILAGYPLVVVRDADGRLRGYHNVCRHRAGPLVAEGKGRCGRELVCRFHGWRYGLDGGLVEATGFGSADSLDPDDLSLFPVRVETWRGLVFVNLDMAATPLAQVLEPLDKALGPQPRRSAKVSHRHTVACNWKVYAENYLDGYHREGVHPTAGHLNAHHHQVHIDGDIALYGGHHDHGHTAESLWAWVWPNFGLSVYRGVLTLEHLRPEGPDRTVLKHIFLHEAEDAGVEAALVNAERTADDDTWISERVQMNLDAGIYQQGVLSPSREGGVAWFQARLMAAIGET